MKDRVERICAALPICKTLADVGCDHGYMAEYALRKGIAETVYVSDISAGSLKKAETLLAEYVEAGKCIPVLADGMKGLPRDLDCLLIAGLGGEEIVRILSEGYLPPDFVFQPMKNAEKLRRYLVGRGAKILTDETFGEGYFYDLIVGKNEGGSEYTEREFFFGRDNLKAPSAAFRKKLDSEREKLCSYLERENLSDQSRGRLTARLEEIEWARHEQ